MEIPMVPAHPGRSVKDRAALAAALEATRAAYHRLVDQSAGEQWRAQSPTSKWTRAEVLTHLVWALEYLPKEVAAAQQGRGMFNMPKWIADPGSYWMIRWQARKGTPDTLHRRYDRAMDAALATLAVVPDSAWSLGADFYGHGFHSVARLFETPAEHLAEHTADW